MGPFQLVPGVSNTVVGSYVHGKSENLPARLVNSDLGIASWGKDEPDAGVLPWWGPSEGPEPS